MSNHVELSYAQWFYENFIEPVRYNPTADDLAVHLVEPHVDAHGLSWRDVTHFLSDLEDIA